VGSLDPGCEEDWLMSPQKLFRTMIGAVRDHFPDARDVRVERGRTHPKLRFELGGREICTIISGTPSVPDAAVRTTVQQLRRQMEAGR
jgi:hypothetical protein